MRNAVLNINQSAALKLGLDITDIALIDWMVSFSSSGRMEHRDQDGDLYFWVSFKKVCSDLPILGIKERQAARRFNALVDKGVFATAKVATKGGLKVYMRIMPEAYEALYMSGEATSSAGDIQATACISRNTSACVSRDTCSYTLSNERDITDNTLRDNFCAEADSNGTSNGDDPVFVSLPCRRGAKNKETHYDVKESEIRAMQEAFPAVDVRQQYRQMGVWLRANKDRIKTYDGMQTFICKWLSREQDKGWRAAKSRSSAMTANASFDSSVGGEVAL